MLATDKATNKEMAIKMIDKAHIKKEKKEAYARTERDILTKCDSPWIIKLYYTFQDSTYLCIRSAFVAHNLPQPPAPLLHPKYSLTLTQYVFN